MEELDADLVIQNRLGLHARAAAQLVRLLEQYQAEVQLVKNGQAVDARSVLSLLTLECPMGTSITVKARGDDASSALAAIVELIQNKFGEE